MKKIDYIALLLFMFNAQFKSDTNRYYLGFLWWFLEPCLYVVVFYTVFVNFRSQEEGFLYSLMVGLVVWKWIASQINQGANTFFQYKSVVTNYNVGVLIFPIVNALVNGFKFLLMFLGLIIFLEVKEVTNYADVGDLILWWLTALVVIFTYQLSVSVVIPFFPDLKVIVPNILMVTMFVSGIIVPVHSMPDSVQNILVWNPFVYLIEGARGVLLDGLLKNRSLYFFLISFHLLICVLVIWWLSKLKGEFPKRLV